MVEETDVLFLPDPVQLNGLKSLYSVLYERKSLMFIVTAISMGFFLFSKIGYLETYLQQKSISSENLVKMQVLKFSRSGAGPEILHF